MSPKRLYFILIGLLVVITVGSFALTWEASKWLATRSQSTVELKLDILKLQQQQKIGLKAASELETYKQDVKYIAEVLPKRKDQVDALSQLTKIADENNITFGSISFPSSELGNAVAKVAAPVVDESAKTTTASPTTPAPAPKPTATQTKPVDGLPGVSSIQISLGEIAQKSSNKSLTYDQLLSVLRSIEQNRRTMQMTNISITPKKSTTDNSVLYQLTINLNIYIKQ